MCPKHHTVYHGVVYLTFFFEAQVSAFIEQFPDQPQLWLCLAQHLQRSPPPLVRFNCHQLTFYNQKQSRTTGISYKDVNSVSSETINRVLPPAAVATMLPWYHQNPSILRSAALPAYVTNMRVRPFNKAKGGQRRIEITVSRKTA